MGEFIPDTKAGFAALDNIDAVVLVANKKGEIVFTSKAVKRIFGYEPDELLGNGWWDLVAENADERKRQRDQVIEILNGKRKINPSTLYENRNRTREGKLVWTQWSNSITKDGFLVGICQIITEKKEIEEKVKQYAQQIELLYSIDQIILELSPLDHRIEKILQTLEKYISFLSRVTLAVFNHDSGIASLYRKGKIGNRPIEKYVEIPLSSMRSMQLTSPGKPYVVNDLREEKSPSLSDLENLKDGIISYLAVPLYYQDKLLGLLFLCSDKPNPFSAQDAILMNNVAKSLSLAVEQNRLEQSLIRKNAEKELLLKEIHHRVKNNLQVISSLLNLQSANIVDVMAQEAFQKSKDRINSMALIHTKLYESGNLSEIDFSSYLDQLVGSIASSYSPGNHVSWSVDGQGIVLDIDLSINLGLIITELVTNAFKHAFTSAKEGKVEVKLKKKNDEGNYVLSIADNGKGFPETKSKNSNSLGLEIVESLTEQVNGKMEVLNKNGTVFNLSFPPPRTTLKS